MRLDIINKIKFTTINPLIIFPIHCSDSCLDTKGGTAHYVSAYDKDPAGSQWTINKP